MENSGTPYVFVVGRDSFSAFVHHFCDFRIHQKIDGFFLGRRTCFENDERGEDAVTQGEDEPMYQDLVPVRMEGGDAQPGQLVNASNRCNSDEDEQSVSSGVDVTALPSVGAFALVLKWRRFRSSDVQYRVGPEP